MPRSYLKLLCTAGALASLAACSTFADPTGTEIQSALNAPERSAEHKARDADRRPADVIAFSSIKRGDKIVEIAPASGYYTALLSRVVGPTGHIYGIGPERLFDVFANARNTFPEYAAKDPRANVSYSTARLDEVILPEGVDQIWMVLYYHDTYWTGENRSEMNKRFYDALRPGGVYYVIDHVGPADADGDITKSLHRLDTRSALAEIQAAGFSLKAESVILRNADDPRDLSVFDETWRGRTDRVVWKFVKPR
jgi:predicted methyltransferase